MSHCYGVQLNVKRVVRRSIIFKQKVSKSKQLYNKILHGIELCLVSYGVLAKSSRATLAKSLKDLEFSVQLAKSLKDLEFSFATCAKSLKDLELSSLPQECLVYYRKCLVYYRICLV